MTMDLKAWLQAFEEEPENRDRLVRLYPDFDRRAFPESFAARVEAAHSAALDEDALRSNPFVRRCPTCGGPLYGYNVEGSRALVQCGACDWAVTESVEE
jgi:hypothetical protein